MLERTYDWTLEGEAAGSVTYRSTHRHNEAYVCPKCLKVWATKLERDKDPDACTLLHSKTCQHCGAGVIISGDRPVHWPEDLYRYSREVMQHEFIRLTT